MKSAFVARALVLAFPCIAAAQIAILHIKIVEGDQAVHAPGSRSAGPITVQITDETGQPVSSAAVSFRLPEDGPGGQFGNGLRTELAISDSNGRATIRNLQLNRMSGPFQIRIVAAKEQARAGTLSRQYIEGVQPGSEHTNAVKARSGRKWIVLGLLAAGVGGGVGIGVAGRGSPQHPASTPAVTIGSPSITLGKP